MAQLSTSTTYYDQIIKKIQAFIAKYQNNKTASYSEIATEYNTLITEINKYAGTQISKYEPVVKGEPPSSRKMNNFIQSVSDDLNIIANLITKLACLFLRSICSMQRWKKKQDLQIE